MTRLLAALATVAACALPAAADEAFDFSFSFNAEEMSSAAGAARAYTRLYDQAFDSCRERGQRLTLEGARRAELCATDIVNSVIAKANQPLLSAAHNRATGVVTTLAATQTQTTAN